MRGFRSPEALLAAALLLSLSAAAATPSAVGGEVLVSALEAELARSMSGLALGTQERPYFVEYSVLDVSAVEADASLGALVTAGTSRARLLRAAVRVGSYELDSTGFAGGSPGTLGGAQRSLPLDDDPVAIRRDAWLATDAAYKAALEQLAQKRAALQGRGDPEPVPDFSKVPPSRATAPPAVLDGDEAKASVLVRTLSLLLKGQPGLLESSVRIVAAAGSKVLVNSEGTRLSQPVAQVWVVARATAQAPDGMPLRHFVAFSAPSFAGLPPEPELAGGVRKMAAELSALVSAPVVERYLGPVLVTGQAAPELVAQLLEPQLSGERPPVTASPAQAPAGSRSELVDRLRRPVFPPFLGIVDDPTRTSFGGAPLLGAYAFDDQGVAARPVTLVEKGILKTLLGGRRPSKEVPEPNGHGRSLAGTGPTSPRAGNLLVQASPGRSEAELEQELVALCKAQGLPFGLVVRVLDVPALSAGPGGARPVGPSRGRGGLTAPLLVSRIDAADGKKQLVRGASLGEIPVRSLKTIVAAGEAPVVENRPLGAGSPMAFQNVWPAAASFVAPSLLLDELEVTPPGGPQQRPLLLSRPPTRPPEGGW